MADGSADGIGRRRRVTRSSLARLALGAATAAAAMAAGVWIGARTGAATTPAPGSAADPLVSRSYVTKAVTGVLAEAGGRLRTLSAGETFRLGAGTAFVLVAGGATSQAAVSASTTGSSVPAPAPLFDLSRGKPEWTASAARVSVPVGHLLLTGVAGDTVTAGAQGAVLWLLGAEATASGASASAG